MESALKSGELTKQWEQAKKEAKSKGVPSNELELAALASLLLNVTTINHNFAKELVQQDLKQVDGTFQKLKRTKASIDLLSKQFQAMDEITLD